MAFNRKKKAQQAAEEEALAASADGSAEEELEADDAAVADEQDDREPELEPDPVFDRSEGPYDETDNVEDGMSRIDFGALAVPGVDGMNINLEVDEQSQTVVAVTVLLNNGGVQLQAFAAPRSGNYWPEVRGELAAGITEQGGVAEQSSGPLGPQLLAQVPAVDAEGNPGLQSVRFVGVEGPRWLLRGVMLGEAAAGGVAAEVFEDVFRGCVVRRGNSPMAPGDMLPLTMPEGATEAEEPARPDLNPFERGPEITEIH